MLDMKYMKSVVLPIFVISLITTLIIWLAGYVVATMLFIIGAYFIPTIFAYKDNKKQKQAILLTNLLLGWTVLGWIIAMIWAVIKD